MKKTSSAKPKPAITNSTVKPETTVVEKPVQEETNSSTILVGKSSPQNTRLIVLGVLLIALASLGYYFKGSFIAATVNGQPIWRRTLNEKLYKQYGQQTIDMLITEALIEQQARTNGVTIAPDKVASETAKIEESLQSQGQSLDQLLVLQGMSRQDLEKQLKLNLIVQELAGGEASPSAQEVADYIKENGEMLPTELTGQKLNDYVTELLTSQKKSEAIQSWIGNLKQGAKIQTF